MSLESIHLEHLLSVSKGKKERESNGNSHASRYIQIEDLRDDRNVKYCSPSTKSVYAEEKDILIAWDGANAGTIGYNLSGAIGSTIARLRLKIDSVHTPYVGRFLQSRFREIRDNCTGATIPHVSGKHLKSMKIPLPPLPEQKRIAAILDQADALREKRRVTIAKLDELLQSVFLDMFGDPVKNPKGWETCSLSEIASGGFRNGLSPSSNGIYQSEVLTLSAITMGAFDSSKSKSGMFEKLPEDKYVNHEDFLICRGNGNLNLVGIGKFPTESLSDTLFPDTMIAVRLNFNRIERSFLECLWNSDYVRDQLERNARTTNGTHKVNQGVLGAISLRLPPIHLQVKFQERTQELSTMRRRLTKHQLQLNDLFSSLQQRAFRGEL